MKNIKIKKSNLSAEFIKRNKIFKAASPAEKRILIAKDVITQIKNKTYIANEGTWVAINSIDYPEFNKIEKLDEQEQLCNLISPKVNCNVCGIGAAICSAIRFKNHLKVEDYLEGNLDFNDIYDGLTKDKLGIKRIFSQQQLKLIEIAFEGEDGFFKADDWLGDFKKGTLEYKAQKFGKRFKNPNNRIIAIFQNIVDYKGLFVLE